MQNKNQKNNAKNRPFEKKRTENRFSGKSKTPLRHKNQTSKNEDSVRLNKFIADAGICSRREADTHIKAGVVSVNGKTVTELGTKVSKSDIIKFNGQTLRSEKMVYILMNKPKDTITTTSDTHGRPTVLEIIGKQVKEKIYPVGRLDRNTTGVLLLTNDGQLAKKLTHPSHQKKKIYHVFLDKSVTKEDMHRLVNGIELEDGFMQFDAAKYPDPGNKTEVGVELHSGKNRIVRRMFEAMGYKVRKLDRVYFAGLTKKNLPRGKWRHLSEKELAMLNMGSYR